MIRLALSLWLCLAAGLEAGCRQALALGLDVSGSVDAREYRLQLDGLAAALGSDRVRAALLVLPDQPVEILVYEWSGTSHQRVIVPWTPVQDDTILDGVINTLRSTERVTANPGTALGTALLAGAGFLAERPCDRMTLDISADGISNLGPRPQDVQSQMDGRGLTINGLVIGTDRPPQGDPSRSDIDDLIAYFRAYVIRGPDSFVEAAVSYDDYADAMARKLVREIETLTLSVYPAPGNQ